MATRIPNTTLSQPISSLSRSSFAIAGPWWPIPWSEASAARNASSRCARLLEAPHAFVAPSRSPHDLVQRVLDDPHRPRAQQLRDELAHRRLGDHALDREPL